MMIPTLLMLRIQKVYIPLPLFLLWPFLLLAALLLAVAYVPVALVGGNTQPFAHALALGRVFFNLHGLKVDVRSHDGTQVYLRII